MAFWNQHMTSPDYKGGLIQTLDLDSGAVETLYERCGDNRLSSPNDLVFDAHGGFYFTDIGQAGPRTRDRGGTLLRSRRRILDYGGRAFYGDA